MKVEYTNREERNRVMMTVNEYVMNHEMSEVAEQIEYYAVCAHDDSYTDDERQEFYNKANEMYYAFKNRMEKIIG